MVHKQILAARQREPSLPRLLAEQIGIEQRQVARFAQVADALEHLALDEQANPPQLLDLDPLPLLTQCEQGVGIHDQGT
jgi:hypothetical protein